MPWAADGAAKSPYNGVMTSKPPRWTRRALAGHALASWMVAPVAAPVLLGARAQAQPPAATPGVPAAATARAQFQNAARQLAGVKLTRNVEPASRFEA
jgi:hypothetical protein